MNTRSIFASVLCLLSPSDAVRVFQILLKEEVTGPTQGPCKCTGERRDGGTCTGSPQWCYVEDHWSCRTTHHGEYGKWSTEPCKAPVFPTRASQTQNESHLPASALVIHLLKREDRWKKVTSWLDKVHLNYSMLVATNGSSTEHLIPNATVTESWRPDFNARYSPFDGSLIGRQIPLSTSERGCAMSHIRAWQIVAKGDRPILVLEDDAVLGATVSEQEQTDEQDATRHKEWSRTLNEAIGNLPEKTDLLYLSYSLPPLGLSHTKVVGKNLLELEYPWTTTPYMIWPEAARKLLNRLPVDQPVDNWLAKQIALKQLSAYGTTPQLISQVWGINANVDHSDDTFRRKELHEQPTWLAWVQHMLKQQMALAVTTAVDVGERSTIAWQLCFGWCVVILLIGYALFGSVRFWQMLGRRSADPMKPDCRNGDDI